MHLLCLLCTLHVFSLLQAQNVHIRTQSAYGQYQDAWAPLRHIYDAQIAVRGKKEVGDNFCAHITLGIIWGFPNLLHYKQKRK
jgi:hypothetical protein